MKTTMEKVVSHLCGWLADRGIMAIASEPAEIEDMLGTRAWYARKIKQMGYTDCIHIDLVDDNSFVAVLDDGTLMAGGSFMEQDGFTELMIERDIDIYDIYKFHTYSDPNDADNWLITCQPYEFYRVMGS